MPTAESILIKSRAFLDGADTSLQWDDVLAEIGQVEWEMPAGKTVFLYSGSVMGSEITLGSARPI